MKSLKTAKPEKHLLSKSTFMYGSQCPKRLWLYKFRPELKDELTEEQQAIFQKGTDIGELAQQLFSGGIDARPATTFLYQQSVADTAKYIGQGHTVIYEAAFQYNGVLAALDILVQKNGKWYAYEVKGTSKVKEPHINDAALQYYVITNAGIQLEDFFIVHLNTDYIRKGDLDVNQLFCPESVLKSVLELQPFVESKIEELKSVLQLKSSPDMTIGSHCTKPYPCDFSGYCSKDVVEEDEEPEDEYINKNAIREFINELEYPLFFMDFETWMTAVPEYDGHWAFRQVPFQYSVHIQRKKNGPIEHREYLAESTSDDLSKFIEPLIQILEKEGSIVVYNQTFEKTILKHLKRDCPESSSQIDAVLERVVDLMPIFRTHYRTPEMHGSYSIKYVLPAIVSELTYANLEIGNGGDASSAFYNLQFEENVSKVMETRANLLEYCSLDTLAMVQILEKLLTLK